MESCPLAKHGSLTLSVPPGLGSPMGWGLGAPGHSSDAGCGRASGLVPAEDAALHRGGDCAPPVPLVVPGCCQRRPYPAPWGGGTGPTASELKRIFFFYNYFAFSFLHFSNCILSGVSRQATRRAFFSSESTSSRADSNPCFRLTLQLAKGGRRPLKSRSSS